MKNKSKVAFKDKKKNNFVSFFIENCRLILFYSTNTTTDTTFQFTVTTNGILHQ